MSKKIKKRVSPKGPRCASPGEYVFLGDLVNDYTDEEFDAMLDELFGPDGPDTKPDREVTTDVYGHV